MRVVVGNEVYVQAADPQRDRAYRDQARDLIAKLKSSLPGALHYEWVDKPVSGIQFTYATVWFDVGEVDPAYDDLILDFLPMWRGEGYAQGVYNHKDNIVWGGKDNITVYGLPYMNGQDARTKEEAVDGVKDAFRYHQGTIVHELIHYLDQKRYRDGKKPKTYDPKKDESKYVSSPHEFNAFYQSWALFMEDKFQSQVLDEAEVGSLKALDRFYLYFGKSPERLGIGETNRGTLKSLNPKMRRHFLKRAAQLWMDLKDEATGGRDIPNPAEHITTEQQLQKWLRAIENEVKQKYHEEWNEWLDDEYMLKDLVTILSDPEGGLELTQEYSTVGSDWVVAKLPARYRQDYLEAMEKLRQELLSRYKVPVSKAASVSRLALTPDQKKLKKEYLLDQSQHTDKIPTLEEVIDYYWLDYVDQYEDFFSEEELRVEIERLYNESVDRVSWGLHGQDVFRGIALPTGVDPIDHKGLGVFWSLSQDGVANAVPEPPSVVYHARVDDHYVNDGGTVWANCAPLQGPDEEEVLWHKHAPIYIYGFFWPNGDYVEIDDWRTT